MVQKKSESSNKECPHCGFSPVRDKGYGVVCPQCQAWMPEVVSTDPERSHSAQEGWNRRTMPQCVLELLGEYEDVVYTYGGGSPNPNCLALLEKVRAYYGEKDETEELGEV